ncbi:Abi-alpha family protein [Aliarcobacter butzleri]|uniref:Abi-alpha family protein n=1 Tax=Aliarcobacter butzleri TaxID=28197 RepID=UPI00263DE584|nr:Abi-alpha family protein [Aliarcobacter butzleri]MDN5068577.1 Abi-alpha family protein [Aliarcobacter butzleri]
MINLKVEGKEISKAVCDLFSPLTEFSGAIGDHIRIYRKLSVLKTLKKAKEIAKKQNLNLNAPSLKFMIPYIEQVSLEDIDKNLNNLWANLLISSSTNYKSEHKLFIRILSELSYREANLLNYIANSSIHNSFKGYSSHPIDIHHEWNNEYCLKKTRDILALQNIIYFNDINFSNFLEDFISMYQQKGVIINFICIAKGEKNTYEFEESFYSPRTDFDDLLMESSLPMLITLGLIKEFKSPEYWINDFCVQIEVYCLTELGAEFCISCTDNFKEYK